MKLTPALTGTRSSIARFFFTVTVLVTITSAIACNSHKPTPEAPSQPTAAATKVDPATAATITGVVHFTGSVPKPQPIDMSDDPACKGRNAGESVVVHNGSLANVLVYAKQMPVLWDVVAPVSNGTLRQEGCRYVPHVLAIQAGAAVEVLNDDPTTHNIHPMPHANHEWNQSQSPGAEPITKTFDKPELMIPVKCNVHPWMRAYINVMPNPFYALTDKDGAFKITGLPPGRYTIAAVHETLGEQTAQITVAPEENKVADFTFKGSPNPASAAR
jgi:plastocyanin